MAISVPIPGLRLVSEASVLRFWAKVQKGSDCWEWSGARLPRGYGTVRVDRRPWLAHRLSWVIHFGPIRDGMFVCHTCDNPACVRPEHLFEGTALANNRDMVSKNRHAHGPTHGSATHPHRFPGGRARGTRINTAKLSEADVVAIRARFAAGATTQKELAVAFGVSKSAIWYVVRVGSWRHV